MSAKHSILVQLGRYRCWGNLSGSSLLLFRVSVMSKRNQVMYDITLRQLSYYRKIIPPPTSNNALLHLLQCIESTWRCPVRPMACLLWLSLMVVHDVLVTYKKNSKLVESGERREISGTSVVEWVRSPWSLFLLNNRELQPSYLSMLSIFYLYTVSPCIYT